MSSHSPEADVALILKNNHTAIPDLVANGWQARTLYALQHCRTAELGGHIDKCDHKDCGKLHLSYNSCRNRHCPRCQGHLREKWIRAREEELLPVKYFHVVFTLPAELNNYALHQPKKLYDTLFSCAWQTLQGFAANPKFLGAKPGMISILHTWGQNLSLHPHLHCIVPAGGLTRQEKWKPSRGKGNYLFDVKAMSKVFRAKFVTVLRKKIKAPGELTEQLFSKKWVVYAKQPFFGPQQVIEYLGRYTHKIAISNQRIIKVEQGKVFFSMKDYRDGKRKVACLKETEFIRRFAQHILPKGYVRIRHYGILSSGRKRQTKQQVEEQVGSKALRRPDQKPALMTGLCPTCKKGRLVTLMTFDQRGPPPHWTALLEKQHKKKN